MDPNVNLALPGWFSYLNYLSWIVMIISIVSMWKLFIKANRPAWASIIPVYNTVVFIQVAGRPTWWVVLFFIPIVNIIMGIIVLNDFVKAFGKGTGFVLGALFLPIIFLPILAFGDAKYIGTDNAQATTRAPEQAQNPPLQAEAASGQNSPQNPDQPQNPPMV